MNDFLQTFRVAITPLTPIHIGCGMDFEPTNYVIQNNILYNFDPENAELNGEQKWDLQQRGERGDLQSIQKFFRDHADTFKVAEKNIVSVTKDVEQTCNNDQWIGIQRTIFNPHTGIPYLPGSSVKGAIRTAILDKLYKQSKRNNQTLPENNARKLERTLLGITQRDFAQSAFRLVKISDMQAIDRQKRCIIMTPYTGKSRKKSNDIPREIIVPAQYRCFTGEIQIETLNGIHDTDKVPPLTRRIDIQSIAYDCNRFYAHQLKRELDILKNRRLTSDTWLSNIRKLFSPTGEISRQMNNGTAFLIRLGMLGGENSKKISNKSEQNAVWLGKIDFNQKNRQPFGWALVEIQPEKDCEHLKTWCEQENNTYPNLENERQNILKEREAIRLKKQREAAEEQKREKQRLQEIEKKREEEARRAAMSEYDRTIDDIMTLLDKIKPGDAGSHEARQCSQILENAATNWQNAADKNRLVQHVAPILKTKGLKKLMATLQKLRGES